MRAAFDISPMVRKYSVLPFERIRLIRDITDFQLADIRRGIVIIFAAWSGQAVLGLQRLTRLLAARAESLDIVVIDIESMTTQEMNQWFGRELYGKGETFWIREGQIVAFLEAYNPDTEPLILSHSRRLLDERAS